MASPVPTSSAPGVQTPAWFRDVVLYEIFVRSFYDSNGDGIGDLNGITAKLDYLERLGVRAIWLTPIFASPSYHGYDIADYFKINPDFGTEADLVELITEAHRRHIRVLLDFVVGHTSSQHPFFKDALNNPSSKYAGWYRWHDAAHTRYDSFDGVKGMPSLNHTNADVQDYLIAVAKYWLTFGIDGYRCDHALGVSHDFWRKLRAELKTINPEFVLLAEAWGDATTIKTYLDHEFDAAFDMPLFHGIQGGRGEVGDSVLLGGAPLDRLDRPIVTQPRLYPPDAQRVTFISNHDTDRAMSKVHGNVRRAKMGATLLLTLPGTPMIYYGEEIGMIGERGPAADSDKTRREPMDWYANGSGPGMTTWYQPAERYDRGGDGISVEEQEGTAGSLLEHYRELVALRNGNSALRAGIFERVRVEKAEVYAFVRADERSAFMIVLNLADRPSSFVLDLRGTAAPPGVQWAVNMVSKEAYKLGDRSLKFQAEGATSYVLRLE